MTNDEAKSVLEQVQTREVLIQAIQKALSGNQKISLPDGKFIAGKEALETELILRLDEAIKEKYQIVRAVMKIDDVCFRTILIERYINGKYWNDIGNELGIAPKTANRTWQIPALKAFAHCYEEERTVKTNAET